MGTSGRCLLFTYTHPLSYGSCACRRHLKGHMNLQSKYHIFGRLSYSAQDGQIELLSNFKPTWSVLPAKRLIHLPQVEKRCVHLSQPLWDRSPNEFNFLKGRDPEAGHLCLLPERPSMTTAKKMQVSQDTVFMKHPSNAQ